MADENSWWKEEIIKMPIETDKVTKRDIDELKYLIKGLYREIRELKSNQYETMNGIKFRIIGEEEDNYE